MLSEWSNSFGGFFFAQCRHQVGQSEVTIEELKSPRMITDRKPKVMKCFQLDECDATTEAGEASGRSSNADTDLDSQDTAESSQSHKQPKLFRLYTPATSEYLNDTVSEGDRSDCTTSEMVEAFLNNTETVAKLLKRTSRSQCDSVSTRSCEQDTLVHQEAKLYLPVQTEEDASIYDKSRLCVETLEAGHSVIEQLPQPEAQAIAGYVREEVEEVVLEIDGLIEAVVNSADGNIGEHQLNCEGTQDADVFQRALICFDTVEECNKTLEKSWTDHDVDILEYSENIVEESMMRMGGLTEALLPDIEQLLQQDARSS